jgi:hypothetical protein
MNLSDSFLLREDLANLIRRRLGMGMQSRACTTGGCASGVLRAGVDVSTA